MKKYIIPLSLLVALSFAGCGKKKEKKEVASDERIMAKNQDIPIYQSEETFDFDGDEEMKDFAYISDEKDQDGTIVAENDEWQDDEDLTLAWQDEQEGDTAKDYNFNVVNFDLNRNEIRTDQKMAVKENVEIANNAVEKGKKLIVAGHCCPLGSASFNMSLSEKRAKAISDEMVKGGVPKESLTVLGCGSEHVVVLSNSEDREQRIKELAPNRRVEVSIN